METIKSIFSSIASVIFGSEGTSTLSDVKPNDQVFTDESHDSTEFVSESTPLASLEPVQPCYSLSDNQDEDHVSIKGSQNLTLSESPPVAPMEPIQAFHKSEIIRPESPSTSKLQLHNQETPVTDEAPSQISYGLLESNLECGGAADLKFEAPIGSTQPTHDDVTMIRGQGGNLVIHGESSVFSVDNSLSMETFSETDPMSSSIGFGTIENRVGEDHHIASMLTTDVDVQEEKSASIGSYSEISHMRPVSEGSALSTENSPKKVTNALKKLEGFFNPHTSVASITTTESSPSNRERNGEEEETIVTNETYTSMLDVTINRNENITTNCNVKQSPSASVNEDDDNENLDDDNENLDDDNKNLDDDKHSLTKRKRKSEADESPERKLQRTGETDEAVLDSAELQKRRYEHAVQVVMDDLMQLYFQNNEKFPYRSIADAVKRMFYEFGYTCTTSNIQQYKQMYIKKKGVITGVKIPRHQA